MITMFMQLCIVMVDRLDENIEKEFAFIIYPVQIFCIDLLLT